MKIGLKYCGGCNPVYDRTAAVEDLKSSLTDLNISFTPYRGDDTYDACLLVRGCIRNCVSDQKFSNCRRLFTAVCREDFDIIKIELHAWSE